MITVLLLIVGTLYVLSMGWAYCKQETKNHNVSIKKLVHDYEEKLLEKDAEYVKLSSQYAKRNNELRVALRERDEARRIAEKFREKYLLSKNPQ